MPCCTDAWHGCAEQGRCTGPQKNWQNPCRVFRAVLDLEVEEPDCAKAAGRLRSPDRPRLRAAWLSVILRVEGSGGRADNVSMATTASAVWPGAAALAAGAVRFASRVARGPAWSVHPHPYHRP